jgi:hypothetical protein
MIRLDRKWGQLAAKQLLLLISFHVKRSLGLDFPPKFLTLVQASPDLYL